MNYISRSDRAEHDDIAAAIIEVRLSISNHYKIIKQLQERLLRIGTEDEQATKRQTLSSIVADYG